LPCDVVHVQMWWMQAIEFPWEHVSLWHIVELRHGSA
jgi:hypothetical protein